ncbi:MAG: glycosyltransferase [Candidatus Asgardarchaeia archaeon]
MWCLVISHNILFVARNIGPHQEKIVELILQTKAQLTILCSTKDSINEKYKPLLHPHFSKIADVSFINWTLIIIAPILVFLDTLLNNRTIIIGSYTLTFGWAIAFGIKCQKYIFALGGDLLVEPYNNFLKRITTKIALKRGNLLFVDNFTGIKNAYSLGYNGEVSFLPYGVEIPESVESIENKTQKKDETILWVRGVNPIYNIDCFLEALKKLEKLTKIKFKIVFAGSGTSSNSFKSKIAYYQFKNHVCFRGFIHEKSEMIKLYKKSTIYVSSSFSDGTCVSLLEAMANGVTIVVSNFENNEYWIKNQENGFLFNPRDSDELAQILYKLIERIIPIKQRKTMIEKSREKVRKKGSIQSFNEKLQEFF